MRPDANGGRRGWMGIAAGVLLVLAPGAWAQSVYYVRAGGNDRNSGTSPESAWRTVQKAASVLSAGDTVYVGAGTYATRVAPQRAGTSAAPVRWVADISGERTGDAGEVVLRASGSVLQLQNDHHHRFEGFTINGLGSGWAVEVDSTEGVVLDRVTVRLGGNGLVYLRNGGSIEIRDALLETSRGDGVYVDRGTAVIHGTRITTGSGHGVVAQNSEARVVVEGSQIDRFSGGGVRAENGEAYVVDTVLHTISGNALHAQNGAAKLVGAFVTVDTVSGRALESWGGFAWLVNSVVSTTVVGVQVWNGAPVTHDGNVYWQVSSRYAGTSAPGTETIADPQYVDRGSRDYHLRATSPALSAGVDAGSHAMVRTALSLAGREDLLSVRGAGALQPGGGGEAGRSVLAGWTALDLDGARAGVLRNRMRASGRADEAAALYERRRGPRALRAAEDASGMEGETVEWVTPGVKGR